jgi:hypothetical protein
MARRTDGTSASGARRAEGPTSPNGTEQLALLPPAGVPVQYTLSQRTRRIGLAGVARVRQLLAEQAARHHEEEDASARLTPPRAA